MTALLFGFGFGAAAAVLSVALLLWAFDPPAPVKPAPTRLDVKA